MSNQFEKLQFENDSKELSTKDDQLKLAHPDYKNARLAIFDFAGDNPSRNAYQLSLVIPENFSMKHENQKQYVIEKFKNKYGNKTDEEIEKLLEQVKIKILLEGEVVVTDA